MVISVRKEKEKDKQKNVLQITQAASCKCNEGQFYHHHKCSCFIKLSREISISPAVKGELSDLVYSQVGPLMAVTTSLHES